MTGFELRGVGRAHTQVRPYRSVGVQWGAVGAVPPSPLRVEGLRSAVGKGYYPLSSLTEGSVHTARYDLCRGGEMLVNCAPAG